MNADILKLPSVVVLIDCWQSEYKEVNEFYDDIIKFINDTPEITTVVLASYDTSDISTVTNNVWYKHTTYHRKTADVIMNYTNINNLQLVMVDFDDFTHFLELNKEIKNIYLMGHSWGQCIHNRPIGLYSLCNVSRNIIINQRCVWNGRTSRTLDMENDDPIATYIKLKDDIYQWALVNTNIISY